MQWQTRRLKYAIVLKINKAFHLFSKYEKNKQRNRSYLISTVFFQNKIRYFCVILIEYAESTDVFRFGNGSQFCDQLFFHQQ